MKSTTSRASRMRRSTTADQIKQLILTRGLRPGDPLPTEAELCDILEVSRSSVREAIRTLSTLDIVDVRHGHGTYVGAMSGSHGGGARLPRRSRARGVSQRTA